MRHTEIDEQDIIDRYLLRRLPDGMQEEFEQHVLTCSECLDRLEWSRPTVGLIQAGCAGKPSAAGGSRRVRRRWFAAPAWGVAAILAVAVWVTVERAPGPPAPALPGREKVAAPVVELSTFRGSAPAAGLRQADAVDSFRLRLDVRGLDAYESYAVEIVNEQGSAVWSRQGLPPTPGRALELTVENAPLAAGQYWVRLNGVDEASPALLREYSLLVQP